MAGLVALHRAPHGAQPAQHAVHDQAHRGRAAQAPVARALRACPPRRRTSSRWCARRRRRRPAGHPSTPTTPACAHRVAQPVAQRLAAGHRRPRSARRTSARSATAAAATRARDRAAACRAWHGLRRPVRQVVAAGRQHHVLQQNRRPGHFTGRRRLNQRRQLDRRRHDEAILAAADQAAAVGGVHHEASARPAAGRAPPPSGAGPAGSPAHRCRELVMVMGRPAAPECLVERGPCLDDRPPASHRHRGRRLPRRAGRIQQPGVPRHRPPGRQFVAGRPGPCRRLFRSSQ